MRYLSDLCQDQIVELLFHAAPSPLAAMSDEQREAFMLTMWRCIETEIERAVKEERERWKRASNN